MTIQSNSYESSSLKLAPTQRRNWSKLALCDNEEGTSSRGNGAPTNQPAGRGCTFATVVYDEATPTPPCMPLRQESIYYDNAPAPPPCMPLRQESRTYYDNNDQVDDDRAPCSPSTSNSLIVDDDDDSDDEVRNFMQKLSIRSHVQDVAPSPRIIAREKQYHDRFAPIPIVKHRSNENLQVKSILKKKTRHSSPVPDSRKKSTTQLSSPQTWRHTVHL